MGFTKDEMKELRVAYDKAVAGGIEKFTFYGNEVLTAYVKYLLEYTKY